MLKQIVRHGSRQAGGGLTGVAEERCSTPHMEVLLKANCFHPFWWATSFDTLVISQIKHYYKHIVLISNLTTEKSLDGQRLGFQ